ncbi:hypothetical protein BFP72_16075 [Reichenbachiella sp. 5M10]|uniref:DUF2461 domain-containing protein n=1 Tax=Reichenbachiella sp. 5M10 TaxID=1889772 RepID=UPI000C15A530|nr:DUF2461 domain-containing protein [Reichenbachiella sp. 5M10]PIB36809.1 hypothetical protein BFP72_16075 [Reichenbachiella sp. 5M10]
MGLSGVIEFLTELSHNNNKEWFDANRKRYEACRATFISLVGELIEGIAAFDPSVIGVDPRKCVFRINRDIRFAKDKTPYKTNFGALIGEQGKKTEGTGYYIHIAPGHHFIGGGMYKPQPDSLANIRQEIDYNGASLKEILDEPDFKQTFGQVRGEQLKTAPKGYPKDHPMIEILRYKSFYVLREMSEGELTAKNFVEEAVRTYAKAGKFNQFLKNAIN